MATSAGQYVRQIEGYRAFIPQPLPPEPLPGLTTSDLVLLTDADRALGRLDGCTDVLPNPDLFVAMYVRKEAVLSSQIEGTQASLDDLLRYEARPETWPADSDVTEIVRYVAAMNHGLSRLAELPLSLRLLREIHAELLKGARGSQRSPGEFRRSQNWIGPAGSTLATASFVPPPVPAMMEALGNLETFLHDERPVPILLKCAYVHAQFETIHPFLDGNGRVGRLLITFLLCWKGVLRRPLLYLSIYFKRNRQEYYARLQAVRDDGDWEGWIRFFLEGVRDVANEATKTARAIHELREQTRHAIRERMKRYRPLFALQLLDELFRSPNLNVPTAARLLNVRFQMANELVAEFVKMGLLQEITGRERSRVFRFEPYLALFRDPPGPAAG